MPAGDPVAAIERFGPLHATDHRTPYLSLLARMHDLAFADLDRAWLLDHRLDRRSVMRGTFHLVPASRLSIVVCAFGEPRAENVRYLRQAGISPKLAERVGHAVEAMLAGTPLDIAAIKRALPADLRAEATAKTTLGTSALAMVLRWMVESGALGLTAATRSDGAPMSGWERSPRSHARFETLFGSRPACDRERADVDLARWYFAAHGPAAVEDWGWWTGFTTARASKAFAAVGPELDEIAVEGWPEHVYVPTGALDAGRWQASSDDGPAVRLLPYEDAGLKAYRATRHRFFDPAVPKDRHTAFGEVLPSVLLDGRVVGAWSSGAGGWAGALGAAAGRPDRGLSADLFIRATRDVSDALEAELERVSAAVATVAEGTGRVDAPAGGR